MTNSDPIPLNPDQITWSLMLGNWVEFARSAMALPKDADGVRLRESVPDIIMLQAVWFALQHCAELTPTERALGLDRAEVLIDKHSAALTRRWSGTDVETMPPQLLELINDARAALESARLQAT